jgi:hypothetical protein
MTELNTHQSGLQADDITKFVAANPDAQPFFAKGGPYSDFARELQAHASGNGFLMGAAFGVVAIIAAVVLINVKKTDLPAEPAALAGAAA